jgi:hypothetical protein
MRLPFRKAPEPIDLLITNDFGAKLKAAPDPLHVEVYAAITAAQDRLRSGKRGRLLAMHERQHPIYAFEHDRYNVLVLHMDGKYVVTEVTRVEVRPVFGDEPDPDDRCSSCERWSGHPHAEWCSTRCTCPDSVKGHLEGCGS